MAEAYFNKLCGDTFTAMSAGIEPGRLNPIVVQAMHLDNIDLSRQKPKGVDDVLKLRLTFDWVITVCDETSAERCPVFPGSGRREHWGFADPSALQGTPQEKLADTIVIRDAIFKKIQSFCEKNCPT